MLFPYRSSIFRVYRGPQAPPIEHVLHPHHNNIQARLEATTSSHTAHLTQLKSSSSLTNTTNPPPNQPPKMPAGFPNFRHDPTTAPHYIQRSSPSSASSTSQTTSQSQQRYRDSASQPAEGVKLSKYQYPTERGMRQGSFQLSSRACKTDRAFA